VGKIYYKIGIIASIVIVSGGMLTFAMTWRSIGFIDGFFLLGYLRLHYVSCALLL